MDLQLGFRSKVVLVNGGGGGIGRATVKAFAREGALVVYSDISKHGEALQTELEAEGCETHFTPSDATDEAQVEALIAGVVADFGRLDVAVNVVGGTAAADKSTQLIHETTVEAFQASMDLNLKTVFLCMKHEIRTMLRQGGGVIANTASLAGIRYTDRGSPAYSAAKAGVAHLTRKVALDYARKNIRVNAVAPGITASDRLKSRWSPDAIEALVRDQHPMGRAIDPEETAQAFVWICSDKARGITGLTLPVDGGWAAR
jgi:NAD(P)-dependent dehydrogenase (short-subunit alcohol dehydrogenase family)